MTTQANTVKTAIEAMNLDTSSKQSGQVGHVRIALGLPMSRVNALGRGHAAYTFSDGSILVVGATDSIEPAMKVLKG